MVVGPRVVFVFCQSNDEEFSRQLAALCDYYVNDAFGTAHRAHASTEGITKFVERKVRRCTLIGGVLLAVDPRICAKIRVRARFVVSSLG